MKVSTVFFRGIFAVSFCLSLSGPCFSQTFSTSFYDNSHLFALLLLLCLIISISIAAKKKQTKPEKLDLKHLILEQIADEDFFVLLIDQQENIIFASENSQLLSPAIPNLESSKNIETFFSPTSCKLFSQAISRGLVHVTSKKRPFYSLTNVLTKDGASVPFMIVIRPCKEIENSSNFIVTIQKKYVFEKIRQSYKKALNKSERGRKKLEDMDKLKSEFLAICSHELKTPLVSIKGYLDLMSTRKLGELTEKQEKALKTSLRNADNLNSLISTMLDFARMEAGKLEFDLSKQNIVRLVSEAIDSLTPVAAKRGITFEISIPEEIRYVSADESLLNRVLLNLLENAIKFSPDNSEVFVNAQSLNNKIRVSITDSGEGIADDKIELIKTPFYQIDRSDTRPRPKGGLGLGLAIAQRILLGHGTELIIHSELGKGSTFSFDLIAVKNKE